MKRVAGIRRAGDWDSAPVDRVVLDADDRQRRRIVLTGEKGIRLLVDFEKPVTLRHGDALVLEDGTLVAVTGKAEPLIEIRTDTPSDFVRLAWHIGNRHTDAQFIGKAMRIRSDHVLEEMVKGLGALVTAIEASFDPEPAAPHGHHHD